MRLFKETILKQCYILLEFMKIKNKTKVKPPPQKKCINILLFIIIIEFNFIF